MNILSLGAGVQSSTLALMAATGYLPNKLEAAIFADTQAEPKEVYTWLSWLKQEVKNSKYPFPIYTVSEGSLKQELLNLRKRKDNNGYYSRCGLPVYTLGKNGERGIMRRLCTSEFKIKPLTRMQKELADVGRGEKDKKAVIWIGISMDEILRMKPSKENWAFHIWPLITLGFTREDCIKWMKDRKYPTPPRSACIFCPYHSDYEWAKLKKESPEEFQLAVDFDHQFREIKGKCDTMLSVPYLHKSLLPLDKVNFESSGREKDMFNNECEGICGV